MLRLCPSKNLQIAENLLEIFHIGKLVVSASFAIKGLSFFHSSNSRSEIRSKHNSIRLAEVTSSQDTRLDCNSLGSLDMIVANKTNSEAGIMSGIGDCTSRCLSKLVL